MTLPDAAASAAYWRAEADRLRIENHALHASLADLRAETDTLWQSVETAEFALAEAKTRATDAADLSSRAEAALRDRATLEENYAIAKAHALELRQLVDAERHRAQRFADLFGACLNWKDFRKAPNLQRAASDIVLLRAIEGLAAEVPH